MKSQNIDRCASKKTGGSVSMLPTHPEALAHHGGTESTERGFYFFAYREVPIDENKLSYQIRDLRPGISESKSNYGDHGLRTEYFCLSRHLAGQTETFLCVLGASVVNKPCI